jgi:serine/threonine protein kinase
VTKAGPYELGEVIGVGGLGTVYLSSGPSGPVAVKVIRPELADQPGFRTRLLREAELARRVSGPGIVRVLDVDAASAQPYLVTEFLDAPTLSDEIRRRGALTGERLERFANTLIQAVGSIHRANVMHRDLKPTNVLVGADGSAHVLDFGLASLVDASASDEGRGTQGWMAPEVVRGEEPTVAVDVYGWGLVVGYAASGHRPVVEGVVDVASVPVTMRQAVLAALDPNPERRSGAYVPATFPHSPPRAEIPPTEIPPTELPPVRQSKSGRWVLIGFALAVFVALGWLAVVKLAAPKPAFVIYDDVFRNGATLNQFNGTNDVAHTAAARRGRFAIASQLAPDPKFFAYLPDGAELSKYHDLHLWVRSAGVPAVSINVALTRDTDKGVGESRSVVAVDSDWTEMVIPLDALLKDRAEYDQATTRMLWIQPSNSADIAAQGTLLIDDIAFV